MFQYHIKLDNLNFVVDGTPYYMPTIYSLCVHCSFTIYSLYVHHRFTMVFHIFSVHYIVCLLYVRYLFIVCSVCNILNRVTQASNGTHVLLSSFCGIPFLL